MGGEADANRHTRENTAMPQKVNKEAFFEQYERWQREALAEYNARYHATRTLCEAPSGDYDPGDLVEFAENGDAYPHGIGGTGHVCRAVTPWRESPHYCV